MFGKKKKKNRIRGGMGCAYVLSISFVVVALLLINGLIIRAFVGRNMEQFDLRITQSLQFLLPLIMIVFEFWIYDRVSQSWRR